MDIPKNYFKNHSIKMFPTNSITNPNPTKYWTWTSSGGQDRSEIPNKKTARFGKIISLKMLANHLKHPNIKKPIKNVNNLILSLMSLSLRIIQLSFVSKKLSKSLTKFLTPTIFRLVMMRRAFFRHIIVIYLNWNIMLDLEIRGIL